MNYESGPVEHGDAYLLEDDRDSGSGLRRWIIVAVVVIGAIASAFFFFGRGKGDDTADEAAQTQSHAQVPTVSVAVPGRASVSTIVSGTGSLAARRDLPVGVAGEGGRVTDVLVDQGDWVKKGQVLARVDNSVQTQTAASLAAQVQAAKADAELARSDLNRAQQLIGRGFISKSDVEKKTATRDSAEAKVRVAEAQLQETRARNARLDIRAPAAGLILSRDIEPGQIVGAGSGVLFRIAKDGQIEMLAKLGEADLDKVSVGEAAQVTPVGANKTFSGQIWQVAPTIDPQTRQGIARIALPYNKALKPGGFASARISAGANQAPLLPQSAVMTENGQNYIYVLNKDNEAIRRDVTIGDVSDEGGPIEKGLSGTERVVLSAGAFLNEGQKVDPVLKTLNGGR